MSVKRTARIDGKLFENADSYFEVASLSKTLFAYCVMSLARDGVFDISLRLREYAPECFLSSDSRAARVTAENVLTHSSGLMNWESNSDKTICFEPASAFQYSGEGYVYLQKCIESALSLSFQQLLDRYVNEPMGTRIAAAYGAIPAGMPFALPYKKEKGYEPILEENAAYSVYANARDYAKFLRTLFSGNEKERMMERSVRVSDNVRWCAGFGLLAEKYAFQYGDNGDYKALYLVDVQNKSVFLRLTNYRHGLMDAVYEIANDDIKRGMTEFLKFQYGAEFKDLTESNA